ncbi:retrovirus-related pol polyprotein from transposon TNT 1-94 [Tanacetum coccineum]|uniref:Retrovirus-related pol polyprotein from transposon TNT 1-94 n=1 Tax=Tanacetum coccineum TaxID=301880 RepID=A0ABQ5IJC2_9ASTR
MIQVRLNATVRNIRTDNGIEFVNQTLRDYYEQVGISHETSVARTPQQNGVVERQNRTLVEVARTMLIYVKAPLFLWAEAVATASKADIGIFIEYAHKKKAYRIYKRHTQKIIETIHVDFDELTAMASEQLGSGPGLQSMTPATSSSGLVTNPIHQQPCNPPARDDWDRLFQLMFDEYFNPPTIVVSPVLVVNAPRAVNLADSPVSTSINQDAPSTSIPLTQDQKHSLIISQGFEESLKTPHFHDDPLHESLYEDSTSQGSSSNVRPIHTPFELCQGIFRSSSSSSLSKLIGVTKLFCSSFGLTSESYDLPLLVNTAFTCSLRDCGGWNSDCKTESQSDNTIGSPHGFIIYGIEVFEGNEELTKVIDVENWRIDNS